MLIMNSRALLLLVLWGVVISITLGQRCNPEHQRTWQCSGGRIMTLDFVDDDLEISESNDHCTFFQTGSWSVNRRGVIKLSFGGFFSFLDECTMVGDETQCDCYDEDLIFTLNTECNQITGPHGEICVPADFTEDCHRRTCPSGERLINEPNYTPSTNGCGPQNIPFTAPSFSFLDCCTNHDYCYSNCSRTKEDCDNEFYACTYCSCFDAYDGDTEIDICQEIACVYFQAVDEFGCDAYQTAQGNSCICQSEQDTIQTRNYQRVPSKFGPSMLTRDVCDAPFVPVCN
jgi:secretory phospholipase A2